MTSSEIRSLSFEEAKTLAAGAEHYRAYVGPPAQYDFMGATQFRLLCTLGLRDHHAVLDFGCGSLRAGRLLIPYLQPCRFYGLDPNRWLIEEAITRELGQDLINLKKPVFRYDDDFTADRFGASFDFILAQSIFSHTGRDLIATAMQSFQRVLAPGGLALVTAIQPHQMGATDDYDGNGWIYPGCVYYKPNTFENWARDVGFACRLLPWYHPRQTWYALAHRNEDLPAREHDQFLSGAVLRDPQLAASITGRSP